MSVSLGMPELPPPVLTPRRKSRQIKVGSVAVGGDAPISVQSMTTTLTSDVNATLQQIAELTAAGCDIVRVACPSADDADLATLLTAVRAEALSRRQLVTFGFATHLAWRPSPTMWLALAAPTG